MANDISGLEFAGATFQPVRLRCAVFCCHPNAVLLLWVKRGVLPFLYLTLVHEDGVCVALTGDTWNANFVNSAAAAAASDFSITGWITAGASTASLLLLLLLVLPALDAVLLVLARLASWVLLGSSGMLAFPEVVLP